MNLTKHHVVDLSLLKEVPAIVKIALPILTSDDGAPFIIKKTQKYLIPASKSDKEILVISNKYDIKLFADESTTKKPPALILPRGIGRYFCSYNFIKSFSSSFVDIYDDSNNNTEAIILRLWLFLNSSLGWLIREISGRKNLGGGMLKAEANRFKIFPNLL